MASVKRVLMAAINADHPQTGMFYGFEKVFGAGNVANYDFLQLQRDGWDRPRLNNGLVEAAIKHQADWVWLQIQETNILDPDVANKIRARLPRCVVSHWTGDLRPRVGENMAGFCRTTDITFCSSTGQIPMFKSLGAKRAEYLQIGLDFLEDVQGIPEWTPPFRVPNAVFLANYYGQTFPGTKDRVEMVNALRGAGVDIGIVGSGWPQNYPVIGQSHVKRQFHVYRRAKVALSVSNFNDIPHYWSDRFLIAMASGTPVVAKYTPGMDVEFRGGVHCLWYKTTDELVSCVKRLLSDKALADHIGAAGREEVIRSHTWESRFRKVVPTIEQTATTRQK